MTLDDLKKMEIATKSGMKEIEIQRAIALALIDIAESLKDIYMELPGVGRGY